MSDYNSHDYYKRQLILSGFHEKAQKKLQKSSVLVVGAGGLGCPSLQYIAGAGVGTIVIADGDKVEISNLHRQILYTIDDIGKNKALVATERLQQLNPFIKIVPFQQNLTIANIGTVMSSIDVVIDASDNFETRFMLGEYTAFRNIPLVFAAIYGYEAQLSVFNYKKQCSFEDLFPTMPSIDSMPNCSVNGVVGFVPGFIGVAQAAEAIKIITNIGQVSSGKLLLFDLLTFDKKVIKIIKRSKKAENTKEKIKMEINTISSTELKDRISSNDRGLYILDVREPWEYEAFNIGGNLIPLSELPDRIQELPTEKDIIVCCKMGARSMNAAKFIKEKMPELSVYNLSRGLYHWND